MNKIIFLDFDGVITNIESKYNLNIYKIKLLQKILIETGAKIVVTSSWKVGSSTIEEFIKNDFNENLRSSLFLKSIIDITSNHFNNRGDEVANWLNEHKDEVESYVIIDDDDDYQIGQLTHFVQTDTYEGLTEREVKLAIAVLNNKTVYSVIRLNQRLKFVWRLKTYKGESDNRYNFNIDELVKEYVEKTKDK